MSRRSIGKQIRNNDLTREYYIPSTSAGIVDSPSNSRITRAKTKG